MKDILEKLKEDHRLIHTSAQALHSLLEGDGEEKFAFLREIEQELRAFSDQLEKHFKYEESIGKFDELLEDHPYFTTEVSALLKEHKDIIGEAAAISQKAATLEAGMSERLREVAQEFRQLNGKIDSHEHKEMDLLQKAYFTDISETD